MAASARATDPATAPSITLGHVHPTAAMAPAVAEPAINGLHRAKSSEESDASKESPLVVERLVRARIPTKHGQFQLYLYRSSRDPSKEHMAIVLGEIESVASQRPVLARIHSECFTGEVLGSLRCDCGEQLQKSMSMIAHEGAGVVVYLRQEGRGIGLLDKLRAYNLQDQGLDTVDANVELGHQADERTYDEAVLILRDLGVQSIRLLTNNRNKIEQLQEAGVDVVERIPMTPTILSEDVAQYIWTKVERMNHLLQMPLALQPARPASVPMDPA